MKKLGKKQEWKRDGEHNEEKMIALVWPFPTHGESSTTGTKSLPGTQLMDKGKEIA